MNLTEGNANPPALLIYFSLFAPAPDRAEGSVPVPASAEAESADGGSPLSSARSAARPLRQRYSVATHPRRPVLLCSSGYMVTLAEVKWHA